MSRSVQSVRSRYLGVVTLTCAAFLLLFACSCTSSGATDGKQPIAFNHQIHVQENEMECGECHLYVRSTARATIPNIEVCGECHSDEPTTESEEERKLIGYVSRGEKIPWSKLNRVPSHVYFSHRRHTTLGELDCSVCHGSMEELAAPPRRQHVRMSMDWCMRCHEENQVDNDCNRCHR